MKSPPPLLALVATAFVAPPAAACPFCDGAAGGGNPVREAVFGPDFWGNAAAVGAPFAALVGLALLVRGGAPRTPEEFTA